MFVLSSPMLALSWLSKCGHDSRHSFRSCNIYFLAFLALLSLPSLYHSYPMVVEQGLNAKQFCQSKYLCTRDLVLPSNVKYFVHAAVSVHVSDRWSSDAGIYSIEIHNHIILTGQEMNGSVV